MVKFRREDTYTLPEALGSLVLGAHGLPVGGELGVEIADRDGTSRPDDGLGFEG